MFVDLNLKKYIFCIFQIFTLLFIGAKCQRDFELFSAWFVGFGQKITRMTIIAKIMIIFFRNNFCIFMKCFITGNAKCLTCNIVVRVKVELNLIKEL